MTLESTSSGGRVQDALSARPKVAIVTGGSSGIGLEVVKKLIEKGYRVVANSRKITSAMTLQVLIARICKKLEGPGGRVLIRTKGRIGYQLIVGCGRQNGDSRESLDTVDVGDRLTSF